MNLECHYFARLSMKITYNCSYTRFLLIRGYFAEKAALAKLAMIVKICCSEEEILLRMALCTGKNDRAAAQSHASIRGRRCCPAAGCLEYVPPMSPSVHPQRSREMISKLRLFTFDKKYGDSDHFHNYILWGII